MNFEIKRNKGTLLRGVDDYGQYMIDQFSEEPIKVYSKEVKEYLKNNYNLTFKEYVSIIVYDKIVEQPYCLHCGKPTSWKTMSKGGVGKYCSYSCSNYGHREEKSKMMAEMNRKGYQDDRFRPKLLKDLNIKGARTKFINNHINDNDCVLYIGWHRSFNRFKIGACSRCNLTRRMRLCELNSIHVIKSGDSVTIANYEAEIKYINQDFEQFEWFKPNNLKLVINKIKTFA